MILVLILVIGAIAVVVDRRLVERRRGWRVRCLEAGVWAYEELHAGVWITLCFDELGDYRETPAIIDVRSVERWGEFPSWALARRSLIIERLKSELKPPHYTFVEATEAKLAGETAAFVVQKSVPKVVRFPVI